MSDMYFGWCVCDWTGSYFVLVKCIHIYNIYSQLTVFRRQLQSLKMPWVMFTQGDKVEKKNTNRVDFPRLSLRSSCGTKVYLWLRGLLYAFSAGWGNPVTSAARQ